MTDNPRTDSKPETILVLPFFDQKQENQKVTELAITNCREPEPELPRAVEVYITMTPVSRLPFILLCHCHQGLQIPGYCLNIDYWW